MAGGAAEVRQKVNEAVQTLAPHVSVATEKTLATSGKAARSVGQRMRSNLKATGGVLAGTVVLLLVRRGRRGRPRRG